MVFFDFFDCTMHNDTGPQTQYNGCCRPDLLNMHKDTGTRTHHNHHSIRNGEPYQLLSRSEKEIIKKTYVLPEKKLPVIRSKLSLKFVFLTLAGAWCIVGVYNLMCRRYVTMNDSDAILPVRNVMPHSKHLTIPVSWKDSKAFEKRIRQEFEPPFGFTMRDLSRRVLSRKIANSNVLVVAPDAVEAGTTSIPNNLDSPDFFSPFSHGGTFVLHAREQGHVTHTLNAGLQSNGSEAPWNQSLDQWWASFDSDSSQRRPNWILLAVIDPGLEWEDIVWKDSERFLQQSTVTYVVTAIRSRLLPDGTLQMFGLEALHNLITMRYKMQILQVSHYHVEFPHDESVFDRYGPNGLLKNEKDVRAFLQWGAEAAQRYSIAATPSPVFTSYIFGTQGLDLAIPSRRVYIDDTKRITGSESWTQINLYKPVGLKQCQREPERGNRIQLEFDKMDRESGVFITLGTGYPWNKKETTIGSSQRPGIRVSTSYSGTFAKTPMPDQRRIQTHFTMNDSDSTLQVWYDADEPRQSEAACARFDNLINCKTRIIPKPSLTERARSRSRRRTAGEGNGDVPTNSDLLVIMLDPMSRGHFERSMPQTKSILDELDFMQFTQYSAVGDNSGPNQAALYSGKRLADRDGITSDGNSEWLWDTLGKAGYATLKGEDGCIENSNMIQSLQPNTTHGEALNQMFCFDFGRPNCLGSEPVASHLLNYGKQFIDAYSFGSSRTETSVPWAAFLHFVDTHEDTMTLSTLLDPLLAGFLRDMHESGKLSNALVLVTSDHGLHYGSYFQTLSGRRERTEPLLYLKAPVEVTASAVIRILESNGPLWTTPFDVHQTMIDATVGRQAVDEASSLFTPLPEARNSCRGVPAIPERFCDLHDLLNGKEKASENCPRAPQPPSILSFFADIPKDHRPILAKQNCSGTEGAPFNFEEKCICGTSHRDIYPCQEHPWGADGANSTLREEEYFAVVKCPNRVERLDNRVLRRKQVIDRYQVARNRTLGLKNLLSLASVKTQGNVGGEPSRSPDILVVEIDSVSKAHADRHLPLTRKFLSNHLLQNGENGRPNCLDGLCALDFSRFAVVGANSVANQVAALSGCVVSRYHKSCFKHSSTTDKCYEQGLFGTVDGCEACPVGTFPIDPLNPCNTSKATPEQCCTDKYPGRNETLVCKDDSLFEHNLQLFRRGPRRHTTWCPTDDNSNENNHATSTPWLFDVARSMGYITYFGEEFCYDFSPYVTQDNTFPLRTDFELRSIHCRLQSCLENCEGPWPPMGPHLCLEHDDGNPAFSQIGAIWKAYPDIPKFAFLNGIAAHDYDFEWIKMISSLEEYDHQLAEFLEKAVSRKEFENTVIVVRTDHGMQGGPTTVDYSVQVEHREPWTQILLRQDLVGKEALDALARNQDKLATGHDLYHTIRVLMSSTDAAPIPDWSYDLFKSVIPEDRSCKDAKIPADFCPCDGVDLDRAPHFGVCNVYEPYNDLFCTSDFDKPIAPENPEQ